MVGMRDPLDRPREVIPQNRDAELWIGMPKDGRTIGRTTGEFLQAAQFILWDKRNRVDDYVPSVGMGAPDYLKEFQKTPVRIAERKPMDLLALLALGKLDGAVAGRDTVEKFAKKFNAAGNLPFVEIVDLGMAPCYITIALPENDGMELDVKAIRNLSERDRASYLQNQLNGRYMATSYKDAVVGFSKQYGVRFAEIISEITPGVPISGSIEGHKMFDDRINAIADMTETAESMQANGWRPLGIPYTLWSQVYKGKGGIKYNQLPQDILQKLPGTISYSNAILWRTSQALSPEKERAMDSWVQASETSARKFGGQPMRSEMAKLELRPAA